MTIETDLVGMTAMADVLNRSATLVQPKRVASPLRSRFSDATWFDWLQHRDVLIIGAGGIGSWTAMCLTRIGCNVTVMDHDLIEIHNLGGQMYKTTDINRTKVDALETTCRELAGSSCYFYADNEEYAENSYTNPIVIMAVDNMKTRKLAFEKWYNTYHSDISALDCLFIDGRLLAEDYQVYAATLDQADAYRGTLFLDLEVPTELCTLKATTHCSLGIASDIVSILTNFAANRVTMEDPEVGVETRDVPFRIVKSIPFYSYEVTFKADGNNIRPTGNNCTNNRGSESSITEGASGDATGDSISTAS